MIKKKPDVALHAPDDLFTFKLADGTILAIPYLENVPRKIFLQIFEVPDIQMEEFLFDKLIGKDAKKLQEKMSLGEWVTFFENWYENSALTLGE